MNRRELYMSITITLLILWCMLLTVRSIKMQQQLIIAKYNQDQILQVLIEAKIINGVRMN